MRQDELSHHLSSEIGKHCVKDAVASFSCSWISDVCEKTNNSKVAQNLNEITKNYEVEPDSVL